MNRTDRTSRRRALLSLAVGACLVLGAVILLLTRPTPAGQTITDAGASVAAALATAPPDTETPSSRRSPAASTTVPDAPDQPPVSSPTTPMKSAAPSDSSSRPLAAHRPTASTSTSATSTAAPRIADPASISVPALGIDAPVVQVGIADDGQMEVPKDVATVGWYKFGPLPGADQGSSVISGHVDSRAQGPGVFAKLGDLGPGDKIDVTDTDGRTLHFDVVAREIWTKTTVPLDRLFDRGGAGRLVLITCGGSFDTASRHYDDNIAITAVLRA